MARNLFSVPIFFIVFRETLEAVIIISVLLGLVEQLVREDPLEKKSEASSTPSITGSGEKATEYTEPVCPTNGVPISCKLDTSHSRTVESVEPEATRAPSGENATELTAKRCLPRWRPITDIVRMSQSLTVSSPEPDAM